jgi:hypothetical protein
MVNMKNSTIELPMGLTTRARYEIVSQNDNHAIQKAVTLMLGEKWELLC